MSKEQRTQFFLLVTPRYKHKNAVKIPCGVILELVEMNVTDIFFITFHLNCWCFLSFGSLSSFISNQLNQMALERLDAPIFTKILARFWLFLDFYRYQKYREKIRLSDLIEKWPQFDLNTIIWHCLHTSSIGSSYQEWGYSQQAWLTNHSIINRKTFKMLTA